MRKLTIAFDQPQIEVNGIVFDLLKSDGDIFEDALSIEARIRTMDTNDTEVVRSALREVCGYVDSILGEGAMEQISGGKPVGLVSAMSAMLEIAKNAAESYSDYIQREYE